MGRWTRESHGQKRPARRETPAAAASRAPEAEPTNGGARHSERRPGHDSRRRERTDCGNRHDSSGNRHAGSAPFCGAESAGRSSNRERLRSIFVGLSTLPGRRSSVHRERVDPEFVARENPENLEGAKQRERLFFFMRRDALRSQPSAALGEPFEGRAREYRRPAVGAARPWIEAPRESLATATAAPERYAGAARRASPRGAGTPKTTLFRGGEASASPGWQG